MFPGSSSTVRDVAQDNKIKSCNQTPGEEQSKRRKSTVIVATAHGRRRVSLSDNINPLDFDKTIDSDTSNDYVLKDAHLYHGTNKGMMALNIVLAFQEFQFYKEMLESVSVSLLYFQF